MYRINSISNNMVTVQIIENGQYKAVQLLPRNFVLSEEVTSQIRNLEASKAVRVREVKQRQPHVRKTEPDKAGVPEASPKENKAAKEKAIGAVVTEKGKTVSLKGGEGK